MAVDKALLTALREQVGVAHAEELGAVTAAATRRYAAAVGDSNPLYTDAGYARSLGYADVLAPPNFLAAVIDWTPGAPYEDLREDGTAAGTHLPGVPASGVRIMGGGEEMTFERPVVAGTVVRRTTVLTEVTRRESSSGPMLVARYQDLYTDDDGAVLLRTVRTVLLR